MASRLPTNSARDALAGLTRTKTLQGVAALMASEGGDFTYRGLAAASGVPERTLYRYFPSKDLLLAEFWTWLNREQLALPRAPRTVDELIGQIPELFAAFDRHEPLLRAMLRDPRTHALRLADADARLAEIGSALAAATRRASPALRRKFVACARLLTSAAGWATFKDLGGLRASEAAAAAQWSLRAMLAAIDG